MNSCSDFQIIGGGVNGLLLARELAAAGASVTLVERRIPGQEASWAGGGIVSPLYPWRYAASITALASWAQAYYPQLAEALMAETGIDVELNSAGLLMLDADDRRAALDWAQRYQRRMSELNASEVSDKEPALASGFESGLWMPEVANIRNPRLLQALLASLKTQSKVQIITNTEVVSWRQQGQAITELQLLSAAGQQSRLQVSHLVVCAGAWTGSLFGKAGIAIDIHPVKGQMLLYKFQHPPLTSIVLTKGRYLIPRRDGHVLAGSTLEYEEFDKTPSLEARQSLSLSAQQLLPELESMEPIGQWAGLRPGSDDGVPYLGRVPGWNNLSVNAGQFRNGLVLAPASARLMADLLLAREPIIDPMPYDPARRSQTAGVA